MDGPEYLDRCFFCGLDCHTSSKPCREEFGSNEKFSCELYSPFPVGIVWPNVCVNGRKYVDPVSYYGNEFLKWRNELLGGIAFKLVVDTPLTPKEEWYYDILKFELSESDEQPVRSAAAVSV